MSNNTTTLVTADGVTITIGGEAGQEISIESGAYRASIGPLGITLTPKSPLSINNPLSSIQASQWAMNDNQGNSVVISQSAGGRIELNGPDAGIWINGKKL